MENWAKNIPNLIKICLKMPERIFKMTILFLTKKISMNLIIIYIENDKTKTISSDIIKTNLQLNVLNYYFKSLANLIYN